MSASGTKRPLIAAALCAFALAWSPALAQTADNPVPVKPGTVRVTTKPPEPEKWNVETNADRTRRVFKCKPLACSDPQTVSFSFQKSPTLHPNPKALERFAKEELPKSIRAASASREVMSDGTEKIETVSSETTTLKGYPSVVNETKFLKGSAATYIQTAIIFAGPMMIRVQSSSPDEQLAKTALSQFIDVMQIEMGPPPPPGGAPKPQQGQQGI
jgi:hypothetical protein